ncbi:MAG: helix-turn-helix domain-containing protein [Gemmatimonadaceae bacterium]
MTEQDVKFGVAKTATSGRQFVIAHTDLLRASRTEHPRDVVLPPHSHSVATITVMLGGGYWESDGDHDQHLPCMAVVTKPAHTSHSNRVDSRGARCLLLEFPRRSVELPEVARLFQRLRIIDLTRGADLVLRILREEPASAMEVDALSMELVTLLIDETLSPPTTTSGRWLERVRDQLHSDVLGSSTLRALAAEAGCHPVYLARAFRRRFGESVGSYAQRLRLARSARDIADSAGKSLSEVAHRRGYYDHSHLSRDFRLRTGMSPAEWRTRSRSAAAT